MGRVGADSDVGDLLASAWLSPDEETLALVLTNSGSAEQIVEIQLGDAEIQRSSVTRTVLPGNERSQDLGELPANHVVKVPGQSMVSVVVER